MFRRPSLNEIDSVLRNDLQPAFAGLEATRRRVVYSWAITFAVAAGAVLWMLKLRLPPNTLLPFVFVPLTLGAWWSRYQMKAFQAEFREQVMRKLVAHFFPSLSYSPDGHVERGFYDESLLFRTDLHGYEGSDLFSGTLGEVKFRFSELYCWYETETTSSNNTRQRERHTVFQGFFFVGDFQRDFFFRTTIHPDIAENLLGVLGRGIQRMVNGNKLVDLEDTEFEKMFVVTSDDQVEARYILTPVMMEKLRDFRTRVGHNIHLCFVNGKMFLAVETGCDYFQPHLIGDILNRGDLMRFLDMLLLLEGVAREFLNHPRLAANPPLMPTITPASRATAAAPQQAVAPGKTLPPLPKIKR
jgi:Protein of unknown function (DUF3137)